MYTLIVKQKQGPQGATGPSLLTPIASQPVQTATWAITSPTQNSYWPTNLSAASQVLIEGTPTDGVEITVVDSGKTWGTHALTFISQNPGLVRDPGNLAAADTEYKTLTLTGASVTFKWFGAASGLNLWLPI